MNFRPRWHGHAGCIVVRAKRLSAMNCHSQKPKYNQADDASLGAGLSAAEQGRTDGMGLEKTVAEECPAVGDSEEE